MRENNEYYNTNVLPHEFGHINQNLHYYYILEALEEIISAEYFTGNIDSYKNAIIRAQVLMEIIGSRPVLEAVVKKDTSKFENEIKKYLEPEEADELLELFETSPHKISLEDSRRIDYFLARMYEKIFGKKISEDDVIPYIYNYGPLQPDSRSYFNQRLDSYYNSTINVKAKILFDIDKTQQYYYWSYYKKVSEEEYINSD